MLVQDVTLGDTGTISSAGLVVTTIGPGGGGGGDGGGKDNGSCSTAEAPDAWLPLTLALFALTLVALRQSGSVAKAGPRRACLALAVLMLMPASFGLTGCTTVRQREAERRADMEAYTFNYSYPEGRWPSPQDKRTLRDLDNEGWRAVREERSVKDGIVTITIHYER